MIYNNVSIKKVIAKVFTDFDLQEGTHRISDMIEWSGEALEKIGAFPYFETRVTGKDNEPIIEFSNYQARLPLGFHRLIQIGYSTSENGPFYPMRQATGSMEFASQMNSDIDDSGTVTTDQDVSDSSLIDLAMSIYSLSYESALQKINDEPATKSLLISLLQRSTHGAETSLTSDYIYVIKNNWIKMNIQNGYLMMSYQRIPVDLDGYPMIPDDPGFMEAVYWYIVMKLLYPQWKDGRVRDAVYYDAKSSWNFYCKQAYGNAMMPDSGMMESLKNSWLRLIPEINEHDSFFSNLGEEQVIFNHNR